MTLHKADSYLGNGALFHGKVAKLVEINVKSFFCSFHFVKFFPPLLTWLLLTWLGNRSSGDSLIYGSGSIGDATQLFIVHLQTAVEIGLNFCCVMF